MSGARNTFRGFQRELSRWYDRMFKGTPFEHNTRTLAFRFFEEAAELVQSAGMTREEAIRQVEYVYGREVGEPFQEVGGTVITLQHLATALEVDIEDAAITELDRISTPEMMAKIYAKQQFKNDNGLIG
jgi:hypothetical protein